MPSITAHLNARLMPMDRGAIFEDPLDEVIQKSNIGHVDGGGTMQNKNGEIEYCDIELETQDLNDATLTKIVEVLEGLGAPKGSKLQFGDARAELPFGRCEGLAVYLNGTDLPDEVYQTSDVNFVYSEINRLLGEAGRILSHWAGPAETALYLYGPSFADMQKAIADFLSAYPLCQRCRIVQIA
jgi:hypothetical protein